MTPENLYIALAQADLAWKDKKTNFLKFEKWFNNTKEHIDLVILPEMFSTGFVTEPVDVAETMEGETLKWMINQAIQNKFSIIGSVIIEENGNYFNRLIWVNRHGEIQHYDKRHLFTYGGEHHQFKSGNKKLIVNINGWNIQPLVCYDLRFPIWAKNEYKNGTNSYDLLIYIANWPSARAYAFRQLLIARAIENQSYVIGVNRVGVDGKGLYYQGNTTAIDFKGNHIIELNPDEELFEIVHLNYNDIQKFRTEFPVGMDWDQFQIEF